MLPRGTGNLSMGVRHDVGRCDCIRSSISSPHGQKACSHVSKGKLMGKCEGSLSFF